MSAVRSIVITGGNGMLAWDLANEFRATYPEQAIFTPGRDALDVTSESSIDRFLGRHRPQVVINAAAYTNVDGAESEIHSARSINAMGPALLARACSSYSTRLVHFSTDQVFDGSGSHPRSETDSPSPVNSYGLTKWEGEKAVLDYPESLVLRVQWLYGEKKDRFSPLKAKHVFTPFADQYGSPTWTRDVARSVITLLQKNVHGLFHFAYDDYASWAEVFAFVKEEWKLPLVLEPKRTQDVALPARRPLFSVLDNRKLTEALGGTPLGSWKTALRAFLNRPSS